MGAVTSTPLSDSSPIGTPPVSRPSDGSLAEEAWERLRAISHDPRTMAATHALMEESGLTLGPMKALRFLPVDGALPMRQLAARMGCDNSYVTSLVDALEEHGLASRETHPTDRRVKVIVLTSAGQDLARRVQASSTKPPAAFSSLTDAEVAALCGLLRKLDTRTDS